jgi:hypothetical protein
MRVRVVVFSCEMILTVSLRALRSQILPAPWRRIVSKEPSADGEMYGTEQWSRRVRRRRRRLARMPLSSPFRRLGDVIFDRLPNEATYCQTQHTGASRPGKARSQNRVGQERRRCAHL